MSGGASPARRRGSRVHDLLAQSVGRSVCPPSDRFAENLKNSWGYTQTGFRAKTNRRVRSEVRGEPARDSHEPHRSPELGASLVSSCDMSAERKGGRGAYHSPRSGCVSAKGLVPADTSDAAQVSSLAH